MLYAVQGKFFKDYAATHAALSKLGTQLPVAVFGGSAASSRPFGSLSDSYSTQEVCLLYLAIAYTNLAPFSLRESCHHQYLEAGVLAKTTKAAYF